MSAHDPSFIKRYKISHTCDVCLRRKTHCDGPDVPGHRCSTCLAANIKCSYTEGLTKRESDKDYVRALEERLGRMEALLLEIHQSSQKAESQAEVAVPARSVRCDPLHILQDYRKSYEDIDPDSDDDNSLSDVNSLSDYLTELKFDPFAARFMGKSSGTTLLKSALELKYKHFRRSSASGLQGGPNVSSAKEADITTSPLFSKKRPEYWEMQEWERQAFGNPEKPEHNRIYVFPEQDLLDTLVHCYFEEGNSIMPLLHRPSFEAGLTEGLHFRDDGFTRVLLLVCAIGSGYVDDPRVLLKDESGLSSGWRWFSQITLGGNALLVLPSLYDLQLASVFLQSSSAPHIYWTLMGTGIRIAQEIGIHRRKVYSGPPNVYDEQWKRAFWMLVVLDRCTSWFLGRPGAIRDEDLDLDLPLEVDDEYWDHSDPARRFQQPAEKPARVTVFIHMIKLTQILGFALRTIYSIKRTRHILHTTGADWEEKNVSQLNLALMQWMDALPSHLRWDANQQNMLWFQQSTFLYASYYVAQLTIYRPFLPDKLKQFDLATEVSGMSPSKLHALAAPALAICTSAARSCAHVIHEHSMRTNTRSPMHIGGAFHAGAFILLNVWTSQKIGNMSPAEISSDMQLVKRCIDVLRACENTWAIAGKYRDLLNEVAGEQSLPGDTSSSSARMGDSSGRALEQDSTTFLQPTSFHSNGHLPHETNDTTDTAQYLESLFSGTHTVPSTQIYKGMPINPTTDGIFEQLLLDWGWSLDKTDVEFPQANCESSLFTMVLSQLI